MPQIMNKTYLVLNLLNNEQKKERKEEKKKREGQFKKVII